MEANIPYSGTFPQAPYQPPQVNGYIQPRPRQVPARPPEATSSASSISPCASSRS